MTKTNYIMGKLLPGTIFKDKSGELIYKVDQGRNDYDPFYVMGYEEDGFFYWEGWRNGIVIFKTLFKNVVIIG